MDGSSVTDEEVAEQARMMGLPVKPEELASLAVGVRRNLEMAAANREVVADTLAPVLFIVPARRPAKGA